MIDKKQIITDFDKIIGNNQEVTDDTHMDLVDECADYTETLVNKLFIANVSKSFATEYAEFCVRCDREKLPLLCLEDYIKQYCC